ncbi:MAG: ATP-binding protein, partial [Micrococcales bacterium]|nr:ATP-binding protein [Micrococcales bacterium]
MLTQPPRLPHRTHKAQQRLARRAISEARDASRTHANALRDSARREAANTVLLPATGDTGPAALRIPGQLRLPQHQDTTATLAGAYPFLAEGGLGSEGVFVGQDMFGGSSFVYDPWVLYRNGVITAPNIVLAGIVGSGKSSLAKSLYTRSMAFGRRVYVPGDPKGEHTPVAEAVGGMAIRLGHGLPARLNPLDEGYRPGHLTDIEWAA